MSTDSIPRLMTHESISLKRYVGLCQAARTFLRLSLPCREQQTNLIDTRWDFISGPVLLLLGGPGDLAGSYSIDL